MGQKTTELFEIATVAGFIPRTNNNKFLEPLSFLLLGNSVQQPSIHCCFLLLLPPPLESLLFSIEVRSLPIYLST